MVDKTRVLRLLRGVADDVGVLRREAAADQTRRADPMWLRGVKYTFITAIEASVDVAQHICAAQGWGPPADNGDAMKLLGKHGVLSVASADTMRKAVGFRNVLVHESDAVVVSRLADLSDFDVFEVRVTEFVSRG